jgi:hypothetical protein
VFACIFTVAFALLVGEFIYSKRSESGAIATVVYEVLPGGLFLTIFASLLRVAATTIHQGRQVAVMVGLLVYTTPSVFVSSYRGDLRVLKSDINYPPLLFCCERVAKELFAVATVYVFEETNAEAQQVATLVLGATLLMLLRSENHFSCASAVRVRRTLIALVMWSSLCALLVVHEAVVAGRILLAVGWVAAGVFAVWWTVLARPDGEEAAPAPLPQPHSTRQPPPAATGGRSDDFVVVNAIYSGCADTRVDTRGSLTS